MDAPFSTIDALALPLANLKSGFTENKAFISPPASFTFKGVDSSLTASCCVLTQLSLEPCKRCPKAIPCEVGTNLKP